MPDNNQTKNTKITEEETQTQGRRQKQKQTQTQIPENSSPKQDEQEGFGLEDITTGVSNLAKTLGYKARSPKAKVLQKIITKIKPAYGGDEQKAIKAFKQQINVGDTNPQG